MAWTETSWKFLPPGDKAPRHVGMGHSACRVILPAPPTAAPLSSVYLRSFPCIIPAGKRCYISMWSLRKTQWEVIYNGVGRVKGKPKGMMKLLRLTRMVATHARKGRGRGTEMKERARNQAGAQPMTWQGESWGDKYLHLSSPIFHSPAGSSSWLNLLT